MGLWDRRDGVRSLGLVQWAVRAAAGVQQKNAYAFFFKVCGTGIISDSLCVCMPLLPSRSALWQASPASSVTLCQAKLERWAAVSLFNVFMS